MVFGISPIISELCLFSANLRLVQFPLPLRCSAPLCSASNRGSPGYPIII